MAQVVVDPGQGVNAGSAMDIVMQPIIFLLNYWYVFLIGLLLAIAIGVIIYLMFAIREQYRERDEPGYFLYKTTVRDAKRNRDKKKYKKKWSKWNLLWLGIPILWKDQSKRVLNAYNETIGRYRGEVQSQDGTRNLLVCVSSIFGIFDTNVLIKIPVNIPIEMRTKNGTKKIEIEYFDLVSEQYNGNIKIDCIGLEQTALFYTMPVIQIEDDDGRKKNVDIRKYVEGSVADSTYQVMLQRMLNTGQKQLEKAMLLNPHLKYDQMSPKKTPEESDLDNER